MASFLHNLEFHLDVLLPLHMILLNSHFYPETCINYFDFQHVGWWSPTIIRGDDREAIYIPNHKFTVSILRNNTQRTHWRIKTYLALSHMDAAKIGVSTILN